jgi:hypothetical protein
MDEVERYHLKTLKLALQKTNEEAEELQRAERARLEKRTGEARRTPPGASASTDNYIPIITDRSPYRIPGMVP